MRKPAFRIVVNTPTTHGSIGLTTGLDPAMMLGCGGHGGNITSDNISPLHLLNIKRVAHELRPAAAPLPPAPASGTQAAPGRSGSALDGDLLASRVRDFLAARGVSTALPPAAPATAPPVSSAPPAPPPPPAEPASPSAEDPAEPQPVEFVCEDDVRQAVRESRSIVVGERTIITPAARDLAARHQVFIHAGLSQ